MTDPRSQMHSWYHLSMYNYVFCLQIKGLSVKTHFLRRELSIVFTVYYFLDGILSIYRFKKDCFPFKDGIQ